MSDDHHGDRPLAVRTRLLIVDDDPLICAMISSLADRHGYATRNAHTALEMAHEMERQNVDCIFLDIDLPDGNGLELLQKLRQHSDIPVIMITGSHSKDMRIEALELGADDYVTKPLNPRELMARLANILRRVHGASSRPVPISNNPTAINEAINVAHS
ncbi:MAG: response regulator transcription factor [Pseudomonadota bacterium]